MGCIAATPLTKRQSGGELPRLEQSVELYGTSYRAIVVHSSAHDQRRQKRLERELAASLTAITTQAKACERKTLCCLADAQAAAQEAMAQPSAYHRLQVSVLERPRWLPAGVPARWRAHPHRHGLRAQRRDPR
ncbi:hypothetical protein U5801_27575 [Lamprobacter modestohalophilus]|uniref:hypothetical protein n=1 Tax=Lamprobacter modestohalophilus TaxID=1064514 RepID=UPI002ADEF8EE|nr:hypothetical protein [Lamprobacter modestohalophilus]MEA1053536.1 hypothetical protein [Lamprobacter modestohalophilus]